MEICFVIFKANINHILFLKGYYLSDHQLMQLKKKTIINKRKPTLTTTNFIYDIQLKFFTTNKLEATIWWYFIIFDCSWW